MICPTLKWTPSASTKSSGFLFRTTSKFKFKAKSRSINWELAPESMIQVAEWFSLTIQGKVRGSSVPRSPDIQIEDILTAEERRRRRARRRRDLRVTTGGTYPDPSYTTSSKAEKPFELIKETGRDDELMAPGGILALCCWPLLATEGTSFLKPHREEPQEQ